MKLETKILLWFLGTFMLPPISWLLSAWFFNVWNTEEMFKILFRINIPGYIMIVVSIIYFIVKKKIKDISNYNENPNPENLIKAQKSARFIPVFFLFALPVYTTLGDFPVLLPLDFIDNTEFLLGISIGVPIVFLFAIPFFITMNSHLEKFTKDIPFSEKYKPMGISGKMTVIFLLSIIGVSFFFISGVMGVMHNNHSANIVAVLLQKLGVTSLTIFLLMMTSLRMFKKQILKPITNIKDSMKEIADGKGDLTKRLDINARDETGEMSFWFNQFMTNMNSIVVNINKTSTNVFKAGSELAEISSEIAQRANEQAATTEEIAASMEEILARLESNTANAEKTSSSATESAKEIIQNRDIFRIAIEKVSEISKNSLVITDIAFQTNILSLNAAIAAAKAGVAGRGFAVVAQEIGNLASKSKVASEGIIEKSKTGVKASIEANESLSKITSKIEQSAAFLGEIMKANEEQKTGVQAINSSIYKLTEITNRNSTSSEQMSASAQRLKSQAETLQSIISQFKISNIEN